MLYAQKDSLTNRNKNLDSLIRVYIGLHEKEKDLTFTGTKISEAYGGTNQSTYTLGDMLYASAVNTLSKLAYAGYNECFKSYLFHNISDFNTNDLNNMKISSNAIAFYSEFLFKTIKKQRNK